MQIEKPKSGVPAWVIVVAVLLGGGILSLPFFAKSGKATSMTKASAEAPIIENKQAVSVAASFEAAEAVAATEPTDLPLEQELELKEVDLPSKIEPLASVPSVEPQSKGNLPPASALLTSFYGNVKVIGKDGEVKLEKNKKLSEGDTIEVGATGEAVIQIEELYVLRLKPNSSLKQETAEVDPAYSGKERVTYRFRLDKGALLGTTRYRGENINALKLLIQDKVFDVQDSTFRVQLTDAEPWIGVLRGSIRPDIENTGSNQPIVIRALEKVAISSAPLQSPLKVSEQEWGLLRETYEMNMKSAAEEAMQLDLSKRGGDFFEYVFDHGTFYTEDVGYTVRDFYEDKDSGEVYLEAEYDVFPSNSFVGIYVLTRDLDAQNYGGLKFDVRRKPEEGYPDRFYVELKSKGQIIHRFEITGIKPNWESRQIEFFSPISTPITEVTLVFLNESIGQNKKGYIQMRNLEMVPLNADQKTARDNAKKSTQPSLSQALIPKQAPRSVRQSVLTEPVKQARVIVDDTGLDSVPYKLNESKKIANEVPKIVSLDDIS